MALKFQCPKCHTEIVVQHLKPGVTAKCRQCGNLVAVPESSQITEEDPSWKTTPATAAAPAPPESEFGPKDVGDIIGGSIFLYRKNFLPLLILTLIFQVPAFALQWWQITRTEQLEAAGSVDLGDIWLNLTLRGVAYFFCVIIFYPATVGGSIYRLGKFYTGLNAPLGQCLRIAIGRAGALIGSYFLIGLACLLLSLTIIGIPVALYLGVAWVFASKAVIIERKGPVESIKRSYQLIKGNWWRTFGIILIVMISYAIISIPFRLLGLIPWFLVLILLTPISYALCIILYFDLRARKEGYNKEMLRKDLEALDLAEGESPAPASDSGPMQPS